MRTSRAVIVLAAAVCGAALASEEWQEFREPEAASRPGVSREEPLPPQPPAPPQPAIGSETLSAQGQMLDPGGEGLGGRQILVRDRIQKLREDRAAALREGKPVGALDEEIARLEGDAAGSQSAPVPAAPQQ